MTEMDRVTQQNASLVQQSAAASASLEDQASRLAQAVAVFKTGQHGSFAPVKKPQTPRKAVAGEGSWETF